MKDYTLNFKSIKEILSIRRKYQIFENLVEFTFHYEETLIDDSMNLNYKFIEKTGFALFLSITVIKNS